MFRVFVLLTLLLMFRTSLCFLGRHQRADHMFLKDSGEDITYNAS